MEQTLHDLSEILVRAIPTIIILVLLHNFLKAVLFGPMEKMLKQRGELTHGARHAAEASLANAERKTADYEAKLREAKAAVYKEQEDTRKTWLSDQSAQVGRAKADAQTRVAAAKTAITAIVLGYEAHRYLFRALPMRKHALDYVLYNAVSSAVGFLLHGQPRALHVGQPRVFGHPLHQRNAFVLVGQSFAVLIGQVHEHALHRQQPHVRPDLRRPNLFRYVLTNPHDLCRHSQLRNSRLLPR